MTSELAVILAGPTAVGKTSLGIKLAREYRGEIISADSRQVYKHLDIGTGKDIGQAKFVDQTQKFSSQLPPQFKKQYTIGYYPVEEIPIWLLDVVAPDRSFNVAEFVALAGILLQDIRARQKLPLVVGGTGFYLTGLVDGYETMGIAPNEALRSRLEKLTVAQLQKRLKQADPNRWSRLNEADRQNPRRLIRAIEVARSRQKRTYPKPRGLGKVLFVALEASRDVLYQRIDQRIKNRLDQGLIDEIKRVLKLGFTWDDPGLNTLGYKQLRPYFEGKQPLEEAVVHWQAAEHNYARQQLRWFKNDDRYHWFDPLSFGARLRSLFSLKRCQTSPDC